MNIYDTANKLAQEIRESQEYIEYKKAKQIVMQNQELKEKIEEFEKVRYDVQVLTIKGNEDHDKKMAKLQELYTILVQNNEIKEYFDLEVKFNVMVADVNKIIAEAIRDVL